MGDDQARTSPYTTTAADGVANTLADFGFVAFTSVGDFVFIDTDGDGLLGTNESGQSGVQVTLYENSDGDGVRSAAETVGTRITDNLGGYEFTDVEPGDYCVSAAAPAGFELSVGGDGRSSPYCFTLLLGQSERDADFAFAPFGSIGDLVFEDLDLDGVRDADEPGIEGVVVDLYDATGTLYDSVTTAGDGSYAFIGVAAGTYTVEVTTPTGFSATNAGPDANADDQARTSPYTTTAADGVANTLADFGFVAFTSVGDFVFIDTDGDGLLGTNESGQSGVQVTLYENSDGDGVRSAAETVGTRITDNPWGVYEFYGR